MTVGALISALEKLDRSKEVGILLRRESNLTPRNIDYVETRTSGVSQVITLVNAFGNTIMMSERE